MIYEYKDISDIQTLLFQKIISLRILKKMYVSKKSNILCKKPLLRQKKSIMKASEFC